MGSPFQTLELGIQKVKRNKMKYGIHQGAGHLASLFAALMSASPHWRVKFGFLYRFFTTALEISIQMMMLR